MYHCPACSTSIVVPSISSASCATMHCTDSIQFKFMCGASNIDVQSEVLLICTCLTRTACTSHVTSPCPRNNRQSSLGRSHGTWLSYVRHGRHDCRKLCKISKPHGQLSRQRRFVFKSGLIRTCDVVKIDQICKYFRIASH